MIRTIRRAIERMRKGYCYEDLWQFDSWLSTLIARGLREFKENCHGYPNDIDDWDEWMSTLDEMIECFEELPREIDNHLSGDFMAWYNRRMEVKRQKLHRGFELLEKYYFDLWD